MKTIIFTHAAAKDLDALAPDGRRQVEDGLIRYAATGDGDVKQLSGRQGYRLRVGRYRVIFDEDRHTILAIYIGKRETTTYRRI
jgi:mRNA interferase RelE/StbE